jgi:hypothetical protein
MLRKYDTVRLVVPHPEIPQGEIGSVTHVYTWEGRYAVEFYARDGMVLDCVKSEIEKTGPDRTLTARTD